MGLGGKDEDTVRAVGLGGQLDHFVTLETN